MIRRLQDIGEDPYLIFWILIACWAPAIFAERFGETGEALAPWIMNAALIIALIVVGSRPTKPGANKYGPDPREGGANPPDSG
jgi:uncharacterized membrane protein YhaH (DUF805 family)